MASINQNLLIFPVDFQFNLRDKMGQPLAGGTVYLYSNTDRVTFKNWYYQSGNVTPYDYVPLPNPMTIDAAGNVADYNGNIQIPGFYPYASDNSTVETYFIQIYDVNGTLVNTLYNFPISPGGFGPTPVAGEFNVQNYIINNPTNWMVK